MSTNEIFVLKPDFWKEMLATTPPTLITNGWLIRNGGLLESRKVEMTLKILAYDKQSTLSSTVVLYA